LEIPIQNLYYLLCYAWNKLEEREIVSVSTDDANNLLNLFARVLITGTRYLLHRGLDRGYIAMEEDIGGIRGKIDFSETMKRQLMVNAKLHCRFDELSYDVLHNQILKTTVAQLAVSSDVEKGFRAEMADIRRRLSNVQEIQLRSELFSRVQLHRNNGFYGFLISICEMIYNYYLIFQEDGDARFREFFRDETKMATLFEDFVYNFYRIELQGKHPGYRVKSAEYIHWDARAYDDTAEKLLPLMRTDISIRMPSGYLIIDTKYYLKALIDHHGQKLRSENLYQLFSYLRNSEHKDPIYKKCAGMLLYPTVENELNLKYEIQGHLVAVNTIDLSLNWECIHEQLLDLVLRFDHNAQAAA
jgi:5-methylcytosine-specific restriction enzyme subunit McrC